MLDILIIVSLLLHLQIISIVVLDSSKTWLKVCFIPVGGLCWELLPTVCVWGAQQLQLSANRQPHKHDTEKKHAGKRCCCAPQFHSLFPFFSRGHPLSSSVPQTMLTCRKWVCTLMCKPADWMLTITLISAVENTLWSIYSVKPSRTYKYYAEKSLQFPFQMFYHPALIHTVKLN